MTEVLKYDSGSQQWVNGDPPVTSYPYTGVWQGGPRCVYGDDPWKRDAVSVRIGGPNVPHFVSDSFGDASDWFGADSEGYWGFKPGASGLWSVSFGWKQGDFNGEGAQFFIRGQTDGFKTDFPRRNIIEQPRSFTLEYIFEFDNNSNTISTIEFGNTENNDWRTDFCGAWAVVRRLRFA